MFAYHSTLKSDKGARRMKRVDLPTLMEETQLAITKLDPSISESRNPEQGTVLAIGLEIHEAKLKVIRAAYLNIGYSVPPRQDEPVLMWRTPRTPTSDGVIVLELEPVNEPLVFGHAIRDQDEVRVSDPEAWTTLFRLAVEHVSLMQKTSDWLGSENIPGRIRNALLSLMN
jgi:hypothetical protein